MQAPSVPLDAVYTPFWCEENVYLLAHHFLSDPDVSNTWDIFAVFISNNVKTVALWNQKLAKQKDHPVIWDYHVILVLRPRQLDLQSWVYDFDSRLGLPISWTSYFFHTFSLSLVEEYQSLFRVVSGTVLMDHFASDRSHMIEISSSGTADTPTYLQPPPTYAPLCGRCSRDSGITNNLADYISMMPSSRGFGNILDIQAVSSFFRCSEI